MKTIEEQIKEFARKLTPCGMCYTNSDGVGCRVEIEDCAWYKDIYKTLSEVAKLQREIDEEVRLKKSDEMTKAEYDREVAFAEWYSENGKGTPTFSDAIEWARKKIALNTINGGRYSMELPKIRKCQIKDYKYRVGCDSRGGWSLAKTRWQAVKLWFRYVTGII